MLRRPGRAIAIITFPPRDKQRVRLLHDSLRNSLQRPIDRIATLEV
jgi:hypothetical protein